MGKEESDAQEIFLKGVSISVFKARFMARELLRRRAPGFYGLLQCLNRLEIRRTGTMVASATVR